MDTQPDRTASASATAIERDATTDDRFTVMRSLRSSLIRIAEWYGCSYED